MNLNKCSCGAFTTTDDGICDCCRYDEEEQEEDNHDYYGEGGEEK